MILMDSVFWVMRAPGYVLIIVFSVAMLFVEIGLAALPGLGVLLVAIAAQWFVGRCQGKAQKLKQGEADRRLTLEREAVIGVRALKYGAWEEMSEARIYASREKELGHL
jgi:hypothetical protein